MISEYKGIYKGGSPNKYITKLTAKDKRYFVVESYLHKRKTRFTSDMSYILLKFSVFFTQKKKRKYT